MLDCIETGNEAGPAVVLLHGFADSRRSFDRVLPLLPRSLRIIVPSLRGHGDSPKPERGHALGDHARDVEAVLDERDISSAVLVGHSMGSAVAQRFAIDRPARVRGLVLAGAAPSARGTPEAKAFWDATLASLADPIPTSFLRDLVARSFVRPVPEEVIDAFVGESAKVPLHVWRETLSARWRGDDDFATELDRIRAPTLVLWGEHDARYVRAEQDALVARIARARLAVFEGCGHMLHVEEPERFARDIATFVVGT